MKFIFLFLSFFIYTESLSVPFYSGYKARKAYQRKDYNCVKDLLEKEQVDSPNDPELNYNLGNAFYKLGKYENAKSNFERAVQNSSKEQNKLQERSYFNWGNSFYKNSLRILGDDWEKKDIDEKKLEASINQIERAIEKYQNVSVLNKENKKVSVNKKKAEELLQKLKQKQQQQKQDQKDKQDKEKKDQDKQKQEQQKKDQEKSQEQKEKEEKDSSDQDSTDKGRKDPDSQKQKKERQDRSQDGKEDKQDGENDKLDKQQDSEKEQGVKDKDKHDKDPYKKEQEQKAQSEKDGKDKAQEKQEIKSASQQDGHEEQKEKGMRMILDGLQSDESKLQKRLIMQKSKGEQQRMNSKQKPW